jgi:fatty acid amide hydrolase 2
MVPGAEPAPVTERSALSLARAIRARELSAREVVEAHIERTIRWAPHINAVIAERFDAARAEADAADAAIGAAGPADPLPPLLGVPCTVKESIAVEGMPNAAGVLARRDHRATASAPAVQHLAKAGAIVIGVTNTSELTLWIESDNPLYGRSSTPYDPGRTAGGSSGGEGAAVGSGGSAFGLGSDIAGSIRIPALFCGVFGHKPSAGLVPTGGMWPPADGDSERMLGVGPLTRRAEDLMPLLEILSAGAAVGDPAMVSLEGLPVTVLEGTSRRPLDRELRDARERAVGALAAVGARLRTVTLPTWRRALLPYLAALQDGSDDTTIGLLEAEGEPRPRWRDLLSNRTGHTVSTRVTLASELLPDPGGSAAQRRMTASASELAAELHRAIGDGVVLHPAHPRPAPRHGSTRGRPWLLTPAAMFNLAGVPVTEVPLGLSRGGLPLGVQVAAGAGRDDVAIAVALELERVFGGWAPPAGA